MTGLLRLALCVGPFILMIVAVSNGAWTEATFWLVMLLGTIIGGLLVDILDGMRSIAYRSERRY